MATVNDIVDYFVSTHRWDVRNLSRYHARNYRDRHKAFFIYRRAKSLSTANPGLLTEANQTTIKAQLTTALSAVDAYINAKIGTSASRGPYYGGTDNNPSFPLLDLADVARRKTREQATHQSVRRRRRDYTELRRRRTIAIVWRAAGIHPALWGAGFNATAMDSILDRRLRTVERMNFNVASHGAMGGNRWRVTGTNGPWEDGFRVRMFEYARVPNSRLFRNAIGTANIGPDRSWEVRQNQRELAYNNTAYTNPSVRFPDSQVANWHPRADRLYNLRLLPAAGVTGDVVMDQMFTPHTDWWHRCWLFCDHVVAAIHLDALIHSQRRKEGHANAFNTMVSNRPDYVSIDAVLGRSSIDVNRLMADDADPYFDNTEVPLSDLEVGDQLIFWNSHVYDLISSGDWRLENAIVMDVFSAPTETGVELGTLVLQGHGTHATTYTNYTNVIASKLRSALSIAQDKVLEEVRRDASITSISMDDTTLVKWSPYGTAWRVSFRGGSHALGAWWVRVPFGPFGGRTQALNAVAKSVADQAAAGQPGVGAGYVSPPFSNSVYFPLFEPRMRSGWQGYLDLKRRNRPVSLRRLQPVLVDGSIMPGIQVRGDTQPIAVVRPKIV